MPFIPASAIEMVYLSTNIRCWDACATKNTEWEDHYLDAMDILWHRIPLERRSLIDAEARRLLHLYESGAEIVL